MLHGVERILIDTYIITHNKSVGHRETITNDDIALKVFFAKRAQKPSGKIT